MSQSLDHLTIEQRIGQLFFIGIGGVELDDRSTELLDRISPGGICLFARNIREPSQTRELNDSIKDRCIVPPLISVDQEGGLVDRLRRLMTPMPAAGKLKDQETAGKLGAIIAETIRILGFNMDFAPVVDVIDRSRESTNNGLYSRAFGGNADDAVDLAGRFLERLQDGGCMGCLKHFPGLGASTVDSHEELPSVAIDKDELFARDLLPYRELLKRDLVHSVMVAHALYPNTGLQETSSGGKLLPSSLSFEIVSKLLRQELGFNGLVITDDLEMGAIIKNFGIGEACVLALEAGVDMLAICADAERINDGFNAVVEAVQSGRVSQDRLNSSLERITIAKALIKEPLPFDTVRIAELSDAVGQINNELN